MLDVPDRVAALLAAGDRHAARALVEAVAASEPAGAELGRAAIALFDRDAQAVLEHARRAIDLGAVGPGHQYSALGHLAAEDADAAIEDARKAVELEPSARARSNLASVLLATGHPGDASPILQQLRVEQPSDADVLLNLGIAASQLGDLGEAIVCYSQAFDRRPTDTRPLEQLLEMFADVGKWLGAAAALQLSRSGQPPPEVEVALDMVQVRLVQLIANGVPRRAVDDDTDRTIERLVANALARGPETQLAVARTLLDLDREADARKLVDAIVERHARTPLASAAARALAMYLQGHLAARDGDRSRALELYAQSFANDARRIEACTAAISLLLEDGSADAFAAIPSWLERVPATDRQLDPGLVFNEAVFLARSERFGEARDRLERVLKLTDGDGPLAELASKLLGQLAQ